MFNSSIALPALVNELTNKANPTEAFGYLQEVVNTRLQALAPPATKSSEIVRSAMNYAIKSGHRWRPILVFSIYKTLSGRNPCEVLDTACAIELIHCCTIILD